MNRLVLIGNGYDLAAGLKTSYEDFLVDYFKSSLKQISGEFKNYKDELIEIQNLGSNLNSSIYKSHLDDIKCIDTLLSSCVLSINSRKKLRFSTEYYKLDKEKLEVNIKSNLLQKLLSKQNWRDIESFYFQELIAIYNEGRYPSMNLDVGLVSDDIDEVDIAIKKLNREFYDIKNKLAVYIAKISIPLTSQNSKEPLTSFRKIIDPISPDNFKRFFDKCSTEDEVKKVFVANFNYTPTINNEFLKEHYNEENIVFHNIHGYYENPKEIIFGYGDDSHPLYEKMESNGNDEFLRFIKSFHYPQERSYIDLMNFIESDQFEVQVIGHSLGLSDRVLLKSIFENENCKMIKLYHRGDKDDMSHKYMALSRHCSDKAAMRRKILEYDEKDVVNEVLKK